MNFGMMVLRKIDFDIIWYSVIFAAILDLSMFVWPSDFLSFAVMNIVILVKSKLGPFLAYFFAICCDGISIGLFSEYSYISYNMPSLSNQLI